MTQKEYVLGYLQTHGSITSMDAFGIGITRLSAIIYRLRKEGHVITEERCTGTGNFGKTNYGRYWLKDKKEETA